VLPAVLKLATDDEPHVRLQYVLTTSQLGTPETDELLANILREHADKPLLIDAATTGMRGREMVFLETLHAQSAWRAEAPGRAKLFTVLAKCVLAEANPKRVSRFLDLIAAETSEATWRQIAMLDAFPVPPPASTKPARRGIVLSEPPPAMAMLEKLTTPGVRARLPNISALVHWPGQPGYTPPRPPRPLNPAEQARFDAGKVVYTGLCIQCHKEDGMGQAGLAPPLVNSEWVLGPEGRLVRIILNGLHGPITVDGLGYNLDMPALPTLTDEQIAGAVTYVRRAWDHDGSPVTPAKVKQIREAIGTRTNAWTERELLKIKND